MVRMTGGDPVTAVSDTALSLLYMKAVARLPWMREAAGALGGGWSVEAQERSLGEPFLRGVAHFEDRYRSVSELVGKTRCDAVLEFGAGFAFRGLDPDLPAQPPYLDTDLPDIIRRKSVLLADLEAAHGPFGRTGYRLAPLDVLEEGALAELAGSAGEGPICLVNEGLLLYLDGDAKTRLCDAIVSVLRQRGGEWVTGDVYVRTAMVPSPASAGEDFRRRFRIRENSFASFEAAERWFAARGLRVLERAGPSPRPLLANELLRSRGWAPLSAPEEGRQTWRLTARA